MKIQIFKFKMADGHHTDLYRNVTDADDEIYCQRC